MLAASSPAWPSLHAIAEAREAMMGQLSVEACVEVLMMGGMCGMLRLEAKVLKLESTG